MNDLLPGELSRWHELESRFRQAAELAGFSEVRTPLVEPTALFARSMGETSDVVAKEMYTFSRGDDSLTIRPEGTAGAVRAYIENKVYAQEPVTRWYYMGPMYRAERPQRGRYRQFFQAGVELFGDRGPAADAEVLALLYGFLLEIGVEGLQVHINSLGDSATRARYRSALLDFLKPKLDRFDPATRQRIEINPLRLLDAKGEQERELAQEAPTLLEFSSAEDREHFEKVQRYLTLLEVPFQIAPGLVRGLDYYTRTVFEVQAQSGELGSQNALGGGGRYDPLVQTLGGPDIPGVGFAIGLERVLLAAGPKLGRQTARCFIAPVGEAALEKALLLGARLRAARVPVEVDGRGASLKSMLRRADASGAKLALILGDDELATGSVLVKDLRGAANENQQLLPESRVLEHVREQCRIADAG